MAQYASQNSADPSKDGGHGPRLLVTAGPTHEPIDAVRYIANRSSGRLGTALAEEAASRNLRTTLLLGPAHLGPEAHSHLEVLRFRTTADLQQLLREHWPNHDVLIMAAAVADYRPSVAHQTSECSDPTLAVSRGNPSKIKRTNRPLTLKLEPTPDLLAELASITRPDQRIIGFALEPAERLLESAREKLVRKKLDAIVANPLETMDAQDMPGGATVIFKDGREVALPATSKRAFARQLLDSLRLT